MSTTAHRSSEDIDMANPKLGMKLLEDQFG
jgi:hypothetical protein